MTGPTSGTDAASDGQPRGFSLLLGEVTWLEAGRILARDPRLLFPVGALSQHGPHLPLGTNTLIAEAVARAVSEEMQILCAPTFQYGVPARHDREYSGAAGLRRKTLHRAVNELLGTWEDHGVNEFIIITAHRYEPHLDAILMALTEQSTATVIDLYSIDVEDIVDLDPAQELAGELETSLMLHLAPHLVRHDRVADSPLAPRQYPKYVRGRLPTPPPGSAGVVGIPSSASSKKGQLLLERYLAVVRETIQTSKAR